MTAATARTLAWSRVFHARADQVREARAFLRAALDGCPAADDAIICVSELATNAVLHSASRKADGTFTVRAEVHYGDYVWIEVEDGGGPWDRRAHRDGRPHGLGIVGELASAWGIDGDLLTGWVVWARFDVPPAGPPQPASRGEATATASDPTQGPETTSQALTGLRDALAAHGIATTGMTVTRHTGKLHPAQGPAIGYHFGLYWWPARRLHASRPIYAIHDASDPAGAARRIPRTSSRPPGGALRMPDIIPGGPRAAAEHTAGTGVIERGWFQQLQALEDAIAYRRARVSGPCPDCAASGRRCDDHACDLNLIAAYQQTAIAAILGMFSQIP